MFHGSARIARAIPIVKHSLNGFRQAIKNNADPVPAFAVGIRQFFTSKLTSGSSSGEAKSEQATRPRESAGRPSSTATQAALKPHVPRILVIDGYTAEGRAELEKAGATQAGKLYERMLKKASRRALGVEAEIEIIYPSDVPATEPVEPCPSDFESFDAVAWTGCSLSILAAEDPKVIRQLKLAKHFFHVGLPQFGSCWAVQIAATAAGGKCDKNPRGREMGIGRKIYLTPDGRHHPMYAGKQSAFDVFTSHEDEVVKLPPNALVLAQNNWSGVQAAVVHYAEGEFWGVQYHPEYDLKELAMLTKARTVKLTNMGFFKSSSDAQEYVDELMDIHNSIQNHGPEALQKYFVSPPAASLIRRDLMWKLGIDSDVLLESIRCREVENWLSFQVAPLVERRSRMRGIE